MYQKEKLKIYIENSELRVFSDRIKVRLSKELAQKYDQGYYKVFLDNIKSYLEQIESLKIKYPGNANPILYIYVVPDDNFVELLNFPSHLSASKGGGKPVQCYDLDGFNSAYGLSQNMLENAVENEPTSKIENQIHELSHVIHNQFFSKNRTICEGFAEMLPLYGLDFEKHFDEHREIIKKLDEKEILTAKELLSSEKEGTFGIKVLLKNKTCSFRSSYISAYLLIRVCVEKIVKNNNCSRAEAIQRFLEILKNSNCMNEWLIYDIADAIGIPQKQLLNEKQLQIDLLRTL